MGWHPAAVLSAWRRYGVWSAILGLAVTVAGCAAAPWLPLLVPRAADQSMAVPTEDGTHYVMVESSRRSAPGGLRRTWVRKVTKTCEGDYMLLSESTATRRRAGLRSSAIHEGYVRCVSPEPAAG